MFKENFIRLCNEKKESPSSVCSKVGITPATFSCWTEKSIPRKATLMRIADYFGVTVEDLLSEDEKKPVHVDEPTGTSLSPEEKLLLSCYKKMTESDRHILYALLDKYNTETENKIFYSDTNCSEDDEITTVYDVPIKLYRIKNDNENDIQFYNYFIKVDVTFKNTKIPLKSYFDILDSNKDLIPIANSIFEEANAVPAKIVKTIDYITINEKNYFNVIYKLQIESTDNNGIKIFCPFSPNGNGNNAVFQNIIEYFKTKGVID